MRSKKLGRGLEYLLSSHEKRPQGDEVQPSGGRSDPPSTRERAGALVSGSMASEAPGAMTLELDLALIRPNPFQPRADFDDAGLRKLAASIRRKGVLQPILVRRAAPGYELVAGERRVRAAAMAGLTRIPALCREVADRDMRLLALLENLQRSDLNPIEKAKCFEAMGRDAGLNQVEIAEAVGLDRSSVANYLRLLDLPESLRHAIIESKLNMGLARAILAAPPDRRESLAAQILREGASVREAERLARRLATSSGPATDRDRRVGHGKAAWAREMEDQLAMALGCKVSVSLRSGRGRIVLEVGGREDFDRVYELLMGTQATPTEEELLARRKAGQQAGRETALP